MTLFYLPKFVQIYIKTLLKSNYFYLFKNWFINFVFIRNNVVTKKSEFKYLNLTKLELIYVILSKRK